MYFCKLYDITEYKSSEEFLAKKAVKMGKLIRGGVPDVRSAARSLIHDWNIGKIKYCTQPPIDNSMDIHLSASIVTNPSEQKELEIDNLEELEKNFMTELNEHYNFNEEIMEVESKGPVTMKTGIKQKSKEDYGEGDIIEETEEVLKGEKKKKRKIDNDGYDTKKFKEDTVFKIAGNQSLNKQNKNSAKKMKKSKVKVEKKISNVTDVLDNFSLGGGDYDFDNDYVVE